MLGRGRPRRYYGVLGARAVVLVLFVLAVLEVAPALAQQGVAVGPYWQVEVEGDLNALTIDDVDGDGWAEIVAGTDQGQVILWRAEGEPAWTFGVESDWVAGLSTGDLEGDGRREIFVTAGGVLPTSYLYVLRADGQLLWSYSLRDDLWGAHLFDLDNDGQQEVLLAAQHPVALDDDGSDLAGWPVDALRTPYVQVADVDNDGDDEVVTISETTVTIIKADGAHYAWSHSLDGPILSAAAADLDGDGRGEIVIAAGATLVLFQDDGRPGWRRTLEPLASGWVGDHPGVLLALGGTVAWLTADGDEAWRFVADPRTASTVFGLSAADPDANGRPEIVFGTAGGQVYLLDASGEPLAEYTVGKAPTLIRYADLNGDGRGEVLVGVGGVLSVFGSPTEATAQPNLARSSPTATRLRWAYASRGAVTGLSAGDVDGDGRWEVVVGGRDNKVTLLDKDGA
ncbi:MAG: VCBS repeat-containing protein, partial [Anaerolineae bacterium]